MGGRGFRRTPWEKEQVSSLRLLLKGESLVALNQAITIDRSLPHGHVPAALGARCAAWHT
jgi:hypothetical protein